MLPRASFVLCRSSSHGIRLLCVSMSITSLTYRMHTSRKIHTGMRTDSHRHAHLYITCQKLAQRTQQERPALGLHAIGYRLIAHMQNPGSRQRIQLRSHIWVRRYTSAAIVFFFAHTYPQFISSSLRIALYRRTGCSIVRRVGSQHRLGTAACAFTSPRAFGCTLCWR